VVRSGLGPPPASHSETRYLRRARNKQKWAEQKTWPPSRRQDPKQAIKAAEAGATSSAAFQHRNLMHSAIDSNSSEIRVRGSLRATQTARLVGVAMKAGYRHAFETTNELVRIRF